jgi:hypothetical protein
MVDRLGHRRGGAGIADQVGQPGQVEQAPARVDDQQGDLAGRVAGGQAAGDEPEQARLAAAGVAQDEQVRRLLEQVEPHHLQPVLLHRERQAPGRPGRWWSWPGRRHARPGRGRP